MNKTITGFITLALLSLNIEAQEQPLSLMISADLQYQEYDRALTESATKMARVNIQPAYLSDQWMFTTDIPLISVDGEYVLINQQLSATLTSWCDNDSRNPRLAAKFADLCAQQDGSGVVRQTSSSASGLGDIGLAASYGDFLGETLEWYGSVTLGYKSDSGDAKEGLGSGTTDAFGEASLSWDNRHFGFNVMFGYNAIIGGDYEAFYTDYLYSSAELMYYLTGAIETGINFSFQQESVVDAGSVSSYGLFLTWEVADKTLLQLEATQYSGDFYPDFSVGTSLSYIF